MLTEKPPQEILDAWDSYRGGIIVCDWPSFRQADKATEREV